ncbi:MAG: hypothetical protein QOF76_1419, partial [Solirubrobacteraceae bacterium]|nr:hypothetical protein [Solirubrobacteraceae bacterium]
CVADGAVWAASPLDYAVVKVDPDAGRVATRVRVESEPGGLACTGTALWVSSPTAGTVTEIDPRTATVTRTIQLSRGVSALVAGPGGIWAANPSEGTVSRIDPSRGAVVATVAVGAEDGPAALAATRDAVYVSSGLGGTIARIDPERGVVAEKLHVGHRPQGLAVVGGALWVGVADTGASHHGGTLRLEYSFLGSWSGFDPSVDITPAGAEVFGVVHDGLTAFRHEGGAAGGTVVADLAESLPAPTDGGLTYTFRLRRGLVYSTGQPVRAGDIRFGITRAMRNFLGLNTTTLGAIRGAKACTPKRCDLSRGIVTDDRARTVTFHLTKLEPDLLEVLALPFAVALPPSVGLKAPVRHPLPATGPYRIASVEKHEVRLVRNPRFRSWSAIARPDGYPDAIVLRLSSDPKGAVEQVLSGRIDRIGGFGMLLPADVTALARRAPDQLRQTIAGNTVHVVLNTRLAPFDHRDARRAVAFALDRRALVRAAGGPDIAQATCQLLPPGIPGSRPDCPFTRDGLPTGRPRLAEARRLVRRSGTRGMQVVLQAPPWLPPPVSTLMVRTLRRIGYHSRVRTLGNNFFELLSDSRHRYQIATIQWVTAPGPPGDMMTTFTCHAFLRHNPFNANFTRFCEPEFDRLEGEATRLQAVAPSSADAVWEQVERRLLDEVPAIGIYNRFWSDLVSERLGNFQYNPAIGMLLDQAWVR